MTAPAAAPARFTDPSDPPPHRSSGEHYDLLRLLAAFLVFAGHQKALTGHPEPAFLGFVTWGEVAVGIFFSLSGYLVSESWRRDPSAPRYLLRRALRLLPGLFGVVLFSALVLGPILSPLPLREYLSHPYALDYLRNLALNVRFPLPQVFATNPVPHVVNGSLWTLPMEVGCYLALLLVLRPWPRLRSGWFLWPLAIGLWLTDLLVPQGTTWILYSTNWRIAVHFASYFFFGVALRLAAPPRFSPVPAAMLAAVVLMFGANSRAGYWSAPLCITLLVIGTARMSAAPSRWATRFGDLSYGLYLYAFPMQQAFIASGYALDNPRRGFVAAWLGTVLCAFVSWHAIEKPALRWKPRSRSGSTGKPIAAQATSPPAGAAG
jgi:peptidoglycan/LPS O-acetylase OafA/YrhL